MKFNYGRGIRPRSRRPLVVGTVLGIALIGGGTQAYADDSILGTPTDWSKMFSISGFGTVGVTHSSLSTADYYTNNLFQPHGAGASSKYSFTNNTELGVQLNAQVTSKLSAVLQVIAHPRYDNSYTPEIEWANIKYQLTPDLSIRVGRIALPTFMSADYRKVGYANVWAHAPQEVYNQLPITNSDGVDASWTTHFGRVDNTVQALYGSTTLRVATGGGVTKIQAKSMIGVFDTVEYGALTARAGYVGSDVTFGATAAESTKLYNVGVSYNPGRWFVQGEWAYSIIGTSTYTAWYAMAGYRIGKFTPYLVYSTERLLHTQGSVTNTGQTTYSAGVRWDVYKNVDLKVQYDRVKTPGNSDGYFSNLQSGFTPGSGANVVTAIVDFTF